MKMRAVGVAVACVLVAGAVLAGPGPCSFRSSDEGRIWVRVVADELGHGGGSIDGLYARLTSFGGVQGTALSFGDVDDDGLQEMYVDDYPGYAVDCYEFDDSLDFTVTQAIEYGLPWVLEDLNGDGADELVVQRGDPGLSGDGYMDVYTWQDSVFVFVQRFTFPEMKMIYTPTTLDLDFDGDTEIIFTTEVTFSLVSYVRVASWDHEGDTLALVYTYYLLDAYGGIGAADFDQDSLGEFVVPTMNEFAVFGADSDSIHFSGYVGEVIGFSELALSWDALGDGDVRLLLGSCLGFVPDNWRFEVHRAVGDDTFTFETSFVRESIYSGTTHGGTGDTDRDGREEALLSFYPIAILFEWMGTGYDSTWALHLQNDTGTPKASQLPTWDLNNDSYPDWVFADHRDTLFVYGYNIIPSLTVELTPDATVVPRGGVLGFEATLVNHTPEVQEAEGWTMVVLPNGNPYGPLLGPQRIILNPYQTRVHHFAHDVPENAPLGTYAYTAKMGEYPAAVWAVDSFELQIVPGAMPPERGSAPGRSERSP
jgi:hypothetical protein